MKVIRKLLGTSPGKKTPCYGNPLPCDGNPPPFNGNSLPFMETIVFVKVGFHKW
jgi:hypothetical protein